MGDSLKPQRRYLIPQISPQQYFKSRLPFIHSSLPNEQSFITIFHKRRPNLIKMKQLHALKQKQQRMNITQLRGFIQQDKKIKRFGYSQCYQNNSRSIGKNMGKSFERKSSMDFEKQKQMTLYSSTSKLKLNSYFFHAMNAKMQENKRYFSLDNK